MSDIYFRLFENENLEKLEEKVKIFLSDENIEVFSIRRNSEPNEDNKYLALVVYKLKNKGGNYDRTRRKTTRSYQNNSRKLFERIMD